ncbi:pilus assembly protein, partial [Thioclava sp. BHET1]
MLKAICKRLLRFGRETEGSYTVEALLVLPALVWVNIACYSYFNAFNAIDTSLKATYTIADAISRQSDAVTQNYINGMNSLFVYLNNGNDSDTWIRVTVVTYSGATKSYSVSWSKASSPNAPVLTTASLANMTDILPTLASGDSLILVFTHLDYSAPFDVGLDLSEIT